jgi:hypothetical protein
MLKNHPKKLSSTLGSLVTMCLLETYHQWPHHVRNPSQEFQTERQRQQSFVNTAHGQVDFDTANVLAVRHSGDGGASAISFQHSSGTAMGAVGYKSPTGLNTNLNGAVYLVGGAYWSNGTPFAGGPPAVILAQEGHFGARMFSAGRIQLNPDWTIDFRDHANSAHTTVSESGEWCFTKPVQSPFEKHGEEAPEGRVEAPLGAVYHRTGAAKGPRFFVKEGGQGAHGWVAK